MARPMKPLVQWRVFEDGHGRAPSQNSEGMISNRLFSLIGANDPIDRSSMGVQAFSPFRNPMISSRSRINK